MENSSSIAFIWASETVLNSAEFWHGQLWRKKNKL